MERVGLRTPLITLAVASAGILVGAACRSPSDVAASPPVAVDASSTAEGRAAPDANRRKVEIVEAPSEGLVDAIVRDALTRAMASRRTLLVDVGAAWCEPCQRFRRSAERGELDAAFPTGTELTLLEFDLDRDHDRLVAAGYVSKLIPLFALPAPDGTASGKQIEGGIKGDGAVGFIVPRLQAMLSE